MPAADPGQAKDLQNPLPTAFVHDERCKQHQTGFGHPERPERLDAIVENIKSSPTWGRLMRLTPQPCTPESLEYCHAKAYLQTVARDVEVGMAQLSTGDTTICAASRDIAMLSAGGSLTAVDAVIEGRANNAFCALRPPGHHATPNRGMGFCLYNNVAVAARYAQRVHGVGKVLIADWDVHHGNGTQDVFYEDDSVFFFSTHQSPWYPGTGAANDTGSGAGLGTTLNQPFPAGAGRHEIMGAFADKLVSAANKFRPEMVFISAGFDSRVGDPLGEFRLTDEDFADLTSVVLQIAKDHAGGRLVSLLEGGYALAGLGSAVEAHVTRLVRDARH